MEVISFILFALLAIIKAFLDTLIFRSGKSIFPESWNPFNSYSTTKLTLGLIRLDAYHITMYLFQFVAIGFGYSCYKFGIPYGYWSIALFLIIWGIFFEISWRLFYKKPTNN